MDPHVVRLLTGRVAEAEHVNLSLGAFLQAVQYGPASPFANDRKENAYAGRGVLLRVPVVLVSERFGFGILSIFMDMDVNPVLALLATARGAVLDWDAKFKLNWRSYTFGDRLSFALPSSVPLRQISAFDKQIKDGGMSIRIP